MTAYFLMKKAIEKRKLSNAELQERIDVFYANGNLTTEQYEELRTLINSQQ